MTAVSSQPTRGSRFPTLEKYDVLEELGHGGMATVYRAKDLRLGRDVAVKVIHPHLRDSTEAVRRFSIEARAVAKLRHANIVEVYDVSAPTEAEQYLVVELLRGVTLRKLLEQHGALPAEVAASLCVELLAALAHAHEAGVVHRDVKPENVIIEHRPPGSSGCIKQDDPSPTPPPAASPLPSGTFSTAVAAGNAPSASDAPGDRIRIKLTDFGIAKLLDAQGVTSTGQVLGSPAHMAPEQIEGREVGGRADVFGMGVLMYECMVGHLPFQGTNPAQVLRRVLDGEYPPAENEAPTVGKTWSRIVDQALAADLDARFAGAPQMRDVLTRELARMGVGSPRGEVEAWLDDPAGFAVAHKAKMTARLCTTADEATQRGDVLAAAADYNRALAYAPHDAALMKIVSRMNRHRARRDVLVRSWPYAAAGVLLLGGGIGARSYLAHRVPVPVELPTIDPPLVTVVPPAPGGAIVPVSLVPEVAPAARTLARPVIAPHGSLVNLKPSPREVHFTAVEPSVGVQVSVDGASPTALDARKGFALDDRAHVLKFTCPLDLCENSFIRNVDPGDRPVSLAVHLTIKPGKLVLHGPPGKAYYVGNDLQQQHQSSDLPIGIPMIDSSLRVVKVLEIDTGRSQSVEVRAGQVSKVEFGP